MQQQNANVTDLQTQQSALAAIDAVQGTPGDGSDLASLLGNMQNQFSTLLTIPTASRSKARWCRPPTRWRVASMQLADT